MVNAPFVPGELVVVSPTPCWDSYERAVEGSMWKADVIKRVLVVGVLNAVNYNSNDTQTLVILTLTCRPRLMYCSCWTLKVNILSRIANPQDVVT